jgi:hypothetical protein
MSWDMDDAAEAVGGRLRALELPPGFDVECAVRAGRRSHRRRRRLTAVAAVTLIGTAAASFAVASGDRTPAPHAQYPNRAPRIVMHDPSEPSAASMCEETLTFEAPAGLRVKSVVAVDQTGRYVLGNAKDDAGEERSILWHDGRPTVLDEGIQWVAVNSAGTIAGIDYAVGPQGTSSVYVRRGGRKVQLQLPDGYEAAVPNAINERGDVFGTLLRGSWMPNEGPGPYGYRLPVTPDLRGLDLGYWPADAPDSPQVLAEPAEPAETDAQAVGFDSAGRMYAIVRSEEAVHAGTYGWDSNGTGGPRPVAGGGAPTLLEGFQLNLVRGGFLYGQVPFRSAGEPTPSGSPVANAFQTGFDKLARWNLTTGTVDVFGQLELEVASASGWFVARDLRGIRMLVSPDGASTRLRLNGRPHWISADGKTSIWTFAVMVLGPDPRIDITTVVC